MAGPLCRRHARLHRSETPAPLPQALGEPRKTGLWTWGQREDALPPGSTGPTKTNDLSMIECQPCNRSILSTIDPVAHTFSAPQLATTHTRGILGSSR